MGRARAEAQEGPLTSAQERGAEEEEGEPFPLKEGGRE